MRGGSYLRFAALAAFLACAAWLGASFWAHENAPRTVTAVSASFEQTVTVSGTVVRDEIVVVCPDAERVYCLTGERVRGGKAVAENAEGMVYAPCAGVFSSLVDGYESLSIGNFGEYSPSVPAGAVGRIVTGGWFFIADNTDSDRFSKGDTVMLHLPDECRARVISAENGTVILRCRAQLGSVINARQLTLEVTVASEKGIEVPESAVHRGGDGAVVFVLHAGERVKCPVEVLAEENGKCLVRGDELRQGMEIIADK